MLKVILNNCNKWYRDVKNMNTNNKVLALQLFEDVMGRRVGFNAKWYKENVDRELIAYYILLQEEQYNWIEAYEIIRKKEDEPNPVLKDKDEEESNEILSIIDETIDNLRDECQKVNTEVNNELQRIDKIMPVKTARWGDEGILEIMINLVYGITNAVSETTEEDGLNDQMKTEYVSRQIIQRLIEKIIDTAKELHMAQSKTRRLKSKINDLEEAAFKHRKAMGKVATELAEKREKEFTSFKAQLNKEDLLQLENLTKMVTGIIQTDKPTKHSILNWIKFLLNTDSERLVDCDGHLAERMSDSITNAIEDFEPDYENVEDRIWEVCRDYFANITVELEDNN